MATNHHIQEYTNLGLNVIPIPLGQKHPVISWKEYQTRKATNNEITSWFSDKDCNVGVICGETSENLVALDIESIEVFNKLFPDQEKLLDKTWVHKTGKGIHVLWKLSKPFYGVKQITDNSGALLLEIRGHPALICVPPSLHENGKRYERISKTTTIARVVDPQFIEDFLNLVEEKLNISTSQHREGIRINDLFEPKSVKKGARNSTAIIVATWFRTNGKSTEQTLSEMKEWNVRCCDPQLDDNELQNTVDSAFRPQNPYSYRFIEERHSDRCLTIIWEQELMQMEPKQDSWLVEGYIPNNSITLLGGKRGFYKSWGALQLAVAIATGQPFLSKYKTSQCNVLYVDEENGQESLYERISKIKKGMGITEPITGLAFSSLNGFKIDNREIREELERFIQENNIRVIIVDTLRRVFRSEENDAREMNELFADRLRPLTTRYGITWVLLHHLRKGISGKPISDHLDELRGSSEMANYADSVIIFERNTRVEDRFMLLHSKSRRTKAHDSVTVGLTWSEDSVKFDVLGPAEQILDALGICCNAIIRYVTENNITEFKTGEIIDAMKAEKHSRPTVTRALEVLCDQQKVERVLKGKYKVVYKGLNEYDNDNSDES